MKDQQILDEIREKGIVLEEIENQFGEPIVNMEIYFHEGKYYFKSLECHSSWWYGLGTCQCVNHDTYKSEEITEQEAIETVKRVLQSA